MTNPNINFELKSEYIAVCDLLKATGIAESGGQGKEMVSSGKVKVDGQLELRKAAKIRVGQEVRVVGKVIRVLNAP
ncbi:MAG: RNA-binding S4 domain-containing protein [Planctomycetota bacterium]|nr:RNA-binding S4 domain-containing protein [Planctomycetota bacterium]